MTASTAGISGIDRCQGRGHARDMVDVQIWAALESRHPGLLADVQRLKGPGEKLHIPHALETRVEAARRIDDGVMSVRALAAAVGCCYETARRARKDRVRT